MSFINIIIQNDAFVFLRWNWQIFMSPYTSFCVRKEWFLCIYPLSILIFFQFPKCIVFIENNSLLANGRSSNYWCKPSNIYRHFNVLWWHCSFFMFEIIVFIPYYFPGNVIYIFNFIFRNLICFFYCRKE